MSTNVNSQLHSSRRSPSAAKTRIVTLLLIATSVLIARSFAQPKLQDTAQKLFASLSNEEKKQALVPFDAPERTKIKYEGGPRAGIQIKTLNPEQQKLAENLLTQFTSENGKKKAQSIADQPSNTSDPTTGFARLYLCFFGDPTIDKNYAWRVAEHHLTIVHVEVADGKPTSFGPILLGANPPNLWDDEEQKMIDLFATLSSAEKSQCMNPGKSNSSEFPKPEAKSIRLSDLSPGAHKAAVDVLEQRLGFFSEPIQKEIRHELESAGGADALQMIFNGAAEKKCRDGGRWDFKLFNEKFLCDYENTRAHIHFSLKSNIK
jgi:hypothetical protein